MINKIKSSYHYYIFIVPSQMYLLLSILLNLAFELLIKILFKIIVLLAIYFLLQILMIIIKTLKANKTDYMHSYNKH